MEKKTAIVVINNKHFDSQRILAYNNVERIAWFAGLVDDNVSINDPELVSVYDTVDAYCREYNAGCLRSEVFDLVTIEYTEKVNGKFVNAPYPIGDLSMRLCLRISKESQNDTDVRNIAIAIRRDCKSYFGDNTQCVINGYNNDTWDYRLNVYLLGDKCRILNNLYEFLFEIYEMRGIVSCEPEWSVDGIDLSAIKFDGDEDEYDEEIPAIPPHLQPIKVENPKVVDTDTLAPQMETKPEVKEEPKYDGEFVDHIADIWREGHRTILVELSGEKYVINGLFDNQDVIIDCYVADTMQRIDRYFVVGAQEPKVDEAEWYVGYFMKKVAKDRKIGDCWYLSDKQFKFLKEA